MSKSRRLELGALVGLLGASALTAVVSSVVTIRNVGSWYLTLEKPSFTPPNWVFGPAWTILYILMAVAAWRVWRLRPAAPVGAALSLYGGQLILNFLWSLIFFGAHRIGIALIDILALLLLVALTLAAFLRLDRVAGLLIAPYLAWVAFASSLNFAIWRLN